MDTTVITRIARQPAKLLAAVQAVLGLGLIAGWWNFEDSDRIMGALMLALSAVLAAVSEYLTPVADPRLPIGTVVNSTTDAMPTGIVVAKEDA